MSALGHTQRTRYAVVHSSGARFADERLEFDAVFDPQWSRNQVCSYLIDCPDNL